MSHTRSRRLVAEALEDRAVPSIASPVQLTVANRTLAEGAGGHQVVTLSVQPRNNQPVPYTLRFSTVDGTATAQDGDYVHTTGTLTWGANDRTARAVQVTVNGDTKFEPTESFRLAFVSVVTNPLVTPRPVVSQSGGKVTLSNDDARPKINVADASVVEGTGTGGILRFAVILSNPSYQTITVKATAAAGTALAGSDFDAFSRTVTFTPGQTAQEVQVRVNGDTLDEVDETIRLTLTGETAATVADRTGDGVIVDDDPGTPTDPTKPDPPVGTAVAGGPAMYSNGTWFLDRDRNGSIDRMVNFGLPGDVPVVGDWNGDGWDDLGVVRSNWARGGLDWYLDLDGLGGNPERVVQYGLLGDTPIVGDWNGDRLSDLGVVRANAARGGLDWYLDLNGDGYLPERTLYFGLLGDTPVVGDWNGDRVADVGVVRANAARGGLDWYLDLNGDGYLPEGTGYFGLLGDVALVGDWNNDGRDDFGIVRGNWLYMDFNGTGNQAEDSYGTGLQGSRLLAGRWA